MKFARCLIVITLLAGSFAQAKEKCVGLLELHNSAPKDIVKNLGGLFVDGPSYMTCSSIVSVLDKVINRRKTTGRRLENDKPLDLKEAEANLDAALRDAEVRGRLEQVRKQVPDENERLAWEAAILDEEGYYSARDLRIQQLLERVK